MTAAAPKVAVYRFEVKDASGTWKPAAYFATIAHIEAAGGARFLGSKLLVDPAHITPGGTFTPPAKSKPG